jgi:UDP-glucose 6-dehydrogenase
MKIAVIGAVYVGLYQAVLLSQTHDVELVDSTLEDSRKNLYTRDLYYRN